jgi:hypothetical protein
MVAPRNPPRGRGLARTPVRQSPTASPTASPEAGTSVQLGGSPDKSPTPVPPVAPVQTAPVSLEDQLAAAQLLIAQLLKERHTQESSVPPEPVPEPATELATELVYRHPTLQPSVNLRPSVESQFESSVHSNSTSIQKLSELPKLDDGTEPTWISWKLQAKAKLRHSYLFPDELAKLEFLYSRTTGMANRYLTPRMEADSWTSAAEIMQFLDQVFGNRNKVAEAREQYNALTMERFSSFQEFWHEFLHLSGTAQIHESHLLTDLQNKLSPRLQVLIIPTFHTYTSYLKLGQDLIGFDKRMRDIQAVEARTRAARRVATANTSTPASSQPASSQPARHTFATPKLMPRPSFPSSTPSPRATTAPPIPPPRSTPPPQDSCFNCGESGHYAKDCSKPKRLTHGINELEPDTIDVAPAVEGYDIERELEELKVTT